MGVLRVAAAAAVRGLAARREEAGHQDQEEEMVHRPIGTSESIVVRPVWWSWTDYYTVAYLCHCQLSCASGKRTADVETAGHLRIYLLYLGDVNTNTTTTVV